MSTPSFGVVTHAVGHEPMPFIECLDKIAAAGGEHILLLASPRGPAVRAGEAAASHYPDVLGSDPEALRETVAAAGLRVGAVLPMVGTDVSSDAAAAACRAAYAPYADRAQQVGCHTLCISSAPLPANDVPFAEKKDGLRRLAGVMDALVAGSSDPALTVSVDVHYRTLVETLDDCRFLVEAMREPRAGLLLNIGHLTTANQDGWRLIEEYPDRIHTAGWKDHSLAADRPVPVYSVELGTGDTPLARYVAAFKASGNGQTVHFVNVEHPPRGDEVPTLRRSLQHLHSLWATA